MANAYDVVRYPSRPFAQTHPAMLGGFAALFGKPYAPVARSRVLEIGCGEGVNLLNMALGEPDAEFVGVDLAEAPIALARAAAEAIGLENIRFHVQDILTMDGSFGAFDYIIAHGVYAWVPLGVREALMRIIGELLSANGLAFISYNVLPGSSLRVALRDVLLEATQDIESPAEKIGMARSVLETHIKAWSESDPIENAMIVAARKMLQRSAEAFFHDELSPCFAPQRLGDVVAAARAVGLDYLCDAHPQLSAEAFFPSERYFAAQPRTGGDWARFEQLSDIDAMRVFRSSIFCRGGPGDRRVEAGRLRGLWASAEWPIAETDPSAKGEFAFRLGETNTLTTDSPKLAQYIRDIGAAYPLSVSVDAAARDAELGTLVYRLFVAKAVRVSAAPLSFTLAPGERPLASALARFQAERGGEFLASLLHGAVRIENAGVRRFVALLDGTRGREDLARRLIASEAAAPETVADQMSAMLVEMAKLGLMVG